MSNYKALADAISKGDVKMALAETQQPWMQAQAPRTSSTRASSLP